MGSVSCINELEDAVLGCICDMIDSRSIATLFRVGNRLLTLKLCTPFGISRYCDVGEYGEYVGPIKWILPQLKGLKTVSITSLKEARVGSLLVDMIPKSVTSIELVGIDCLEACFERIGTKEEHFFNFASRFPALQSLSLLYQNEYAEEYDIESDSESGVDEGENFDPQVEASNNDDEDFNEQENDEHQYLPAGDRDGSSCKSSCDTESGSVDGQSTGENIDTDDIGPYYGGITSVEAQRRWLDVHIPLFPPTLARLCLNASSWKTPLESVQFPSTLAHLEIGCRVLKSLTWIFDLPLLHTLKLVRVAEVEENDESYQNLQHLNLCTLQFHFGQGEKRKEIFALTRRMKYIFPALPHLENFDVIPNTAGIYYSDDYRGAWKASLNELVSLKSLSCPSTQTALPQTLVQLSLLPTSTVGMASWYRLWRDDVLSLPPSLTFLYAPFHELKKNAVKQLPRTLTSLTIRCKSFKYSALPPLLTSFDNPSFCWNDQTLMPLSKYLPHLKIVSGNYCALFHVKTKLKLSTSRTGWTNLMNAAFREDFDALHRLVVEYMKLPNLSGEQKLRALWRDLYVLFNRLRGGRCHIQLPLTTLNWFRSRGLCAFAGPEASFFKLFRTFIECDDNSTSDVLRWTLEIGPL